MLLRNLRRGVFYSKNKRFDISKPYSDTRDAQLIYRFQENNLDSNAAGLHVIHMLKRAAVTAAFIIGTGYYFIFHGSSMKEKFEIKYLSNLPAKDYDASDYDYKFWELVLTKPHEEYGRLISTDNIAKDRYALVYHGEITGSHMAMQRFSRLQRYVLLRKTILLESLFVAMDEQISPDTLAQYVATYSKDMLAAYPANEEVRSGLKEVFQNIGCIYLLEKNTGNVIYIIDPKKHPLEVMSQRIIYIISKHEDMKMSREIATSGFDFRRGQEDKLEMKSPTY
ncbi:unnamed protein product [Blepharisma stoltei]|uniref:Uncharacterized protein n=1 Tax=Blepharisma stoltei TaxID=1481888 RepID=A0AAU9JI90_9CILI|nr:unnamed protein product [Blepharisma stoltei]